MNYLRYIWNLLRYYGKYRLPPLYFSDSTDAHEHICFAARLLGEDLPYVCPLCQLNGFEPEFDDICENCKYFGVVRFSKDGMKFVLNEAAVEISKDNHRLITFDSSKGVTLIAENALFSVNSKEK